MIKGNDKLKCIIINETVTSFYEDIDMVNTVDEVRNFFKIVSKIAYYYVRNKEILSAEEAKILLGAFINVWLGLINDTNRQYISSIYICTCIDDYNLYCENN